MDALDMSVELAASKAFMMRSAVVPPTAGAMAAAGAGAGVRDVGTVPDELDDASRYPVPSWNGPPPCTGEGPGLASQFSGFRPAVVTSRALPRFPTLALLTRRLSSPSSSKADSQPTSGIG